MPHQLIKNIIELGENQTVEFKSSFNDSAIETISAFSNTKGGSLFIGIDNNGEPIKGFSVGIETIQKWLNEIKIKTQPSIIPDINLVSYKEEPIVEIKVQEFPIKPVAFKGRYYKRQANSNQQLSPVQIADLNLQSLQVSWDSYPSTSKTLKILDKEKINKFLLKVNSSGRFYFEGSPMDFLKKLKFITDDSISNAAYLLFAKDEIEYNIHLGRFKSESTIIDDRILKLTLFQAVEETMKYYISN